MDGLDMDYGDYDLTMEDQEMLMVSTDILNLEDTAVDCLEETDMDGANQYLEFEDQGTMSDNGEQEFPADGVLDEDTIGHGLSQLGRTADGTQQVYLHLTLPGLNLQDISLLSEYNQLQKVEIPYNDLSDLSCLSNLPFLLHLDASHNRLASLLDFTPPRNLRVVNLSFNQITSMASLEAYDSLQDVNLDNNQISEICGVQQCVRLTRLSLAHNRISVIQGLDNLSIKHLNLSNNNLKLLENLGTLRYLQSLHLAGNKLRSLEGLENLEFLHTIDAEDNEIIDLSEVHYVRPLHLLRWLNLLRNPVQELPDYRLSVLFNIQQLTELDRRKVDVHEKVAARNLFNPPVEVIAARDHIMHVVYSFLQPSRVLESTLPSTETPYPMLVLVGPQGAGKKDLSMKLVDEFSDYFGYGVSHTTRTPQEDEINGKDYNFVSLEEFENDVKKGRFIQTYSYNGNLYGLSIDAVETVARDGLACVVHMELEGVLTLKNTYFEPRYVLILALSREAHERRLNERGLYKESQINWNLDRAEMYSEYNREHPGFFDMMINSDDIVDAYRRLRRLVMDYLGISAPSPPASEVLDQSQNGSHFMEREATETLTAGSANMGARTWSKPSIADSASQALASVRQKQTMSPMPASGRGVVEEESIRRRHSAAKEAVMGRRPSLYEKILNRGRTVPQAVSAQMGLGDDEPGVRSVSAPGAHLENMDALPPGSPDSSASNSGASSSLGNISEARGMDEGEGSAEDTTKDTMLPGKDLPSEKIDPLDLMSGSDGKSRSNGPMAPRLSAGSIHGPDVGGGPVLSRPGSAGSNAGGRSSRLGAEKRQVLPPIGTNSPLPSSPLPEY